jgi:anthranilate phosphoribosyltransferase
VHGHQGLDELALSGPSEIAVVRNAEVIRDVITPEDLGLQPAPTSALTGGDAAQNAAILHSIFQAEQGPRRNIVLLNAAAVLVVAGIAANLREGMEAAARAIDSGTVTRLIGELRS